MTHSSATRVDGWRARLQSIGADGFRSMGVSERIAAFGLLAGIAIAGLLAPAAGWGPAAALVATFMLVFGVLRMASANDGAAACAGLIIVAALSSMTAVWAFNGHFMVTRDVGESFSIYLNAHNITDFVTLFVTDNAPSNDPAAHPFYYIHHPNLLPRILSKLQQLAGIDLEHQVFVNILLGGVTLTFAYLALASTVSPVFALLAVAFLGANYAIFYESTSDLARGAHYAAFFSMFYVISRNPRLDRPGLNGSIALLLALLILSDFAAFVFAAAFAVAWIVYLNRTILWKRMFLFVVLPPTLALGYYLVMVIVAVGWDFFLFDLTYTYLGRTGQFMSGHEKLLGALTPEATREAYRNHNVVLFARPVQEWGISDIWGSWWKSLSFSTGALAWVLAAAALASFISFFWFQKRGFPAIAIITAVLFVSLFNLTMPLILLLPLLVFCWTVSSRESQRLPMVAVRIGLRKATAQPLINGAALIVAQACAVFSAASIFPEYTINFLVLGKRAPAPLVDMAAFAWFGLLITILWSALGARTPILRLGGGALAAATLAFLIAHNADLYRRHPPSPPPFAKLLSEPQFRGASFLSTGYHALPWYYTQGWAAMSESGNPPRSLGYNVNLLHMADWRNRAKYGKPKYFLCDVSQYGGGPPVFKNPDACMVPNHCDCRDVAKYYAAQGHTIVHSEPLYSILLIDHDKAQIRSDDEAPAIHQ